MAGTIYQSNNPPIRGSAFTFYISLVSQADTDIFQKTVTLAAGDVKVSKDGAGFTNITALPVEIGATGVLAVALTGTEMTADTVTVEFVDAAGDEWQDAMVEIITVTDQQTNIITAIWANATRTLTSFGTLVADTVSAVWNELQAGYVIAGSFGDYLDAAISSIAVAGASAAEVWAYARRTLTQSLSSILSSVTGDEISLTRGDTFDHNVIVGSLAGYISFWITVKSNIMHLDPQCIFQIKENASGLGDGLMYVNGEVAADSSMGNFVINDVDTGDINIFLDESITDDLYLNDDLCYDFQLRVTGSVTTLAEGTFKIVKDITRSIV